MTVFGSDDAPHGHAHMKFTDVRVPKDNLLLGEGRGFENFSGKIGPRKNSSLYENYRVRREGARITLQEINFKNCFWKTFVGKLGGNYDVIADCRTEIEMCRLLTFKAAYMMDTVGNKIARSEIAQIKVAVPNMAFKSY
ncbi:MAG: hypothetical protein Ct9H300mP20_13310 [Gammaproteobacteria bacterium]|nr:MAG: hypothetical protein Ct9H300mP20_13310 [Gammaproteobacteria bacterium]